jgi:hypothetical protein
MTTQPVIQDDAARHEHTPPVPQSQDCRYCLGMGSYVDEAPDGSVVNRICMYCLGSGKERNDGETNNRE